jgi:hypothetical protein
MSSMSPLPSPKTAAAPTLRENAAKMAEFCLPDVTEPSRNRSRSRERGRPSDKLRGRSRSPRKSSHSSPPIEADATEPLATPGCYINNKKARVTKIANEEGDVTAYRMDAVGEPASWLKIGAMGPDDLELGVKVEGRICDNHYSDFGNILDMKGVAFCDLRLASTPAWGASLSFIRCRKHAGSSARVVLPKY